MENRVIVLLSAYNGEKYLTEQIESALSQTGVDIDLLIRDDGSSDGTLKILEKYENDGLAAVVKGENIGTCRSFFNLLEIAGDAPYYAFCDQDDLWLPDKTAVAIDKLNKIPPETPAACFCRLDIVSENLRHIAYSPLYKEPLGLKTAVCGNVLTGMACVINKAARDIIASRPPEFAIMHDWWAFIVISALGVIIYDEAPLVKYRQHGSNVIGLKKGADLLKKRLLKYTAGGYRKKISRQAEEFYRLYKNGLNADDKAFLEDFVMKRNFTGRFAYAMKCPAYRLKPFDNALLRALIIFNQL